MLSQPELFRPDVSQADVEALCRALGARGWQTRTQLVEALGWSERKIREVAAEAGPRLIVRGPKGFNLATAADAETLMHCARIFHNQAREMETAALAWEGLAHAALGGAGREA